MVQQPSAIASLASFLPMQVYLPDVSSVSDTQMTKLTLQEQMLKAGLVSSKKMAKVQRTAKKSRVQAREAREAVEENKKAQLERDKQLSEQQKQAVLAKEYKAQVKQLIEMNRITVARGDIGFNFTDNNLIKKIMVDKPTQTQLINGRLAIARLAVDNKPEGEYAIIPAVVAEKIAQRDASSIVLHSALSQDEQDEDDPYADFKGARRSDVVTPGFPAAGDQNGLACWICIGSWLTGWTKRSSLACSISRGACSVPGSSRPPYRSQPRIG